jgi:hypothetical protein
MYGYPGLHPLLAAAFQRPPQRQTEALREHLGRLVRLEWVRWAQEQPAPKASWLVPWEGLSEPDREVDRLIGERLMEAFNTEQTERLDWICRQAEDFDVRLIVDAPREGEYMVSGMDGVQGIGSTFESAIDDARRKEKNSGGYL